MSTHCALVTIQWGDVAAWVQGLGTVGAIGVAFWQINGERVHRRESEKREELRTQRSQAERVAAWVDLNDAIDLWNQSELPVYAEFSRVSTSDVVGL